MEHGEHGTEALSGQVSADGRWSWDGARWVPVISSSSSGPVRPRRWWRPWLWVPVAVLVAVTLVLVFVLGQAVQDLTQSPQQRAAGAYELVVDRDEGRMQTALTAAKCQAAVSACRDAWVRVGTVAAENELDLASTPAPACLQAADARERLGFVEYQQASQAFVAALDQGNSTGELAALNGPFAGGTADLKAAHDLTAAARC